jgi:hypothetical protein
MQFIILVATAIVSAVGANAAVVARSGARLAQFRIFGVEGCHDINDGFYLVDTSDVNNCNLLEADPQVVSVNLEVLYTTVPGACTGEFYPHPTPPSLFTFHPIS